MDELRVGGFKSYGAVQPLQLAPLTVLIGPNASGKSNFIEATHLLSWLARSQRLSGLVHAIRKGELPIRGPVGDLPSAGTHDISLGASIEGLELELTVRIQKSRARIVKEELDDPSGASKLPYYWVEKPADAHGAEMVVSYNNFKKGRTKPQIRCVDDQAVFTQLLTPARFSGTDERSQDEIPRVCGQVASALSGILFLDPKPAQMRGYSFPEETELASNGANVSAVLADLCRNQGRGDEVLSFVRTLPEQDIRSIDFLEGARNDLIVELEETFGPRTRKMHAGILSDGTLRVLAIAAAVLSVPEGSLVVIEEIDNGVHPSRAEQLMKALHEVTSRRGVRALLTTHNPALLDAIPLPALGDTVACYRDPESGESRLQRLRDLDDFAALAARGPLGMLATSGVLERFLKHRRTEAERQEQGQQALELFRSGSG